jgi:Ca-activated chloride channel family protein
MGQTVRSLLREIAEQSGGLAFFPNSVYELEDITTKISVELKNQYLLSYVSTNPDVDGEWRDIDVRLKDDRSLPDLTVREKRGYYAPVR